MCLRNLQKILVHGALIEAEILTSPYPMYLLTLAQFWDTSTLAAGVSSPPKWSTNVPICLRNLQKILVHGALLEAEILTSPSPMHLLNLAWFLGTSAPSMDVSTPPKWSRNVPISFRNFQKRFGAWSSNGGRDIDLPTPPCIFSTWPRFWVLELCPQVWQNFPSDLVMFLYVSGTSKKSLVHGALIEAELLTSLPPIYAQLGLVLGTGTLPTGVSTPPK